MILITKEEAKWLASQGAKYKDAIHKTIGVAEKNWLTENTKWHKMLKQRRKDRIVETYSNN